MSIHAVHVNVVAVVIKNVDADGDSFFAREVFAGLGNTLRGCEIDRREIVDSLCRIAADDKFCGQSLRRRRSRTCQNRKKQCHTMDAFHHSLLSKPVVAVDFPPNRAIAQPS